MTPYPFTKLTDLSFEFETTQGIIYYAYFLEYSYMFDNYPEFSENIFTFNLDVLQGDIETAIHDERVGLTIVAVFRFFFSVKQHVAIYICDSSDSRQFLRKRKFDFWFWKYNDGTIIKEDGIAVIENVEIYNSILLHKENKHLERIVSAFKELNERADDK